MNISKNKEIIKQIILFQVSLNPWTKEEKFNIDGQYVPRIFFLDTNGEVLKEFDNELGNTKFSYFYPRDDQCKFYKYYYFDNRKQSI